MELEPTLNPTPLPFPNRRKTVRRNEDVWTTRRMDVLETLLTGVVSSVRPPLTAARTFVENLKDLDHLEVLGEEDVKIAEATAPGQLTMKQLTKQEAQEVYLDRLSKNLNRLHKITEHFQTRLPVQASECQINTMVQRELEHSRTLTEEKRISIRCQGLENLPTVLAYEWVLSQALSFIISRAIHVTRPGGWVTVSGHIDQAQGTVHIDVEDTGPGIAPQLCDAFNRGEELGIGEITDSDDWLWIIVQQRARNVMAVHGGRIAIERNETSGTKFSMSFPVK